MPRRSIAEVATGAAVLAVTAGFLAYALANTGRTKLGGTVLTARFENIGGITPGADVRVAGVKVGSVTAASIDPRTYQGVLTFTVQGDVPLPSDSSAVISSGGLLGGATLTLSPGGSERMLASGGSVTITQSAVNLEDLLGKFIFNVGSLADASQKQLQRGEGQANGASPSGGPARP